MTLFDFNEIVVYTINTNGYDTYPTEQELEGLIHPKLKYFLLTDEPESVPEYILNVYTIIKIPKGGVRLSRYYKINSHLLGTLIGYDADLSIYMDSSLKLQPEWWKHIEDFKLSDINHLRHPDTLSYHVENMSRLRPKMKDEIQRQYERYLDEELDSSSSLTENCFIIRRDTVYSQEYNEDWWDEYCISSERDQLASAYVQYYYKVTILPVNPRHTPMWLGWSNHKKPSHITRFKDRIRNKKTEELVSEVEPITKVDNSDKKIAVVTTFKYDEDIMDIDELAVLYKCINTQKKFCKKFGYDYIILDKQLDEYPHPAWYRFEIHDILNDYDAVLYLDADVYIRKNAESPIDCYTLDKLVALDSAITYPYMSNKARITSKQYRKQCIKYGVENEYFYQYDMYSKRFINSGVMIIPKCCKNLFIKPSIYVDDSTYWEQTLLNIRSHYFEFESLNRRWNAGHIHKQENMMWATEHGDFIHFNLSKGMKRFHYYQRLLNYFEIYGVEE